MSKEILCSISTRGRYDTTLALALMSVINQTKRPDKIVIFDDNDHPRDLRETQHYLYIFQMMEQLGIEWECVFAEKKGQHYNHQRANLMGYKWVWRLDDDTVAEPHVLETLYSHTQKINLTTYEPDDAIGAVGGSVLTPPIMTNIRATGKIEDIDREPNIQWGMITSLQEVDHLHCSFLYRAGIADYCLSLSRVAHREETLFTYELKQKGFKIIVVPNAVTWHLKNKVGGIRDGAVQMFEHDEALFRNRLQLKDQTIVVLDCGMGDHIVFKKVLPLLKNPVVYSCFPEIIPGRSIAEAIATLGSIHQYNVYAKMDQWNWKGSLEEAFKKLYVK